MFGKLVYSSTQVGMESGIALLSLPFRRGRSCDSDADGLAIKRVENSEDVSENASSASSGTCAGALEDKWVRVLN